MGPDQPGLEVGKNEVDDGKKGFGFIRIAVSGNWRPRFSFWADYGIPFA
jgi:hypothetical protein